jgi:ubiquinone/menaquinone biosynthesis C-methylase UbiE
VEGDIRKLIFNDNTFDHVICIATYHHLDNDNDRKLALNELYRVLKNEGTVLITVLSMKQPQKSKFNFTKKNELVSWNHRIERYYHIYEDGDLIEEINRLNGKFKIIDCGWEFGNWWIILSK